MGALKNLEFEVMEKNAELFNKNDIYGDDLIDSYAYGVIDAEFFISGCAGRIDLEYPLYINCETAETFADSLHDEVSKFDEKAGEIIKSMVAGFEDYDVIEFARETLDAVEKAREVLDTIAREARKNANALENE